MIQRLKQFTDMHQTIEEIYIQVTNNLTKTGISPSKGQFIFKEKEYLFGNSSDF